VVVCKLVKDLEKEYDDKEQAFNNLLKEVAERVGHAEGAEEGTPSLIIMHASVYAGLFIMKR
jgi:hypothetical protein